MRFLRRIWEWIDDLSGASAALSKPLYHLVPRARKTRWFYVFGSATLALAVFLLQVVSGTALASSYVTSTGSAYDSLQFITAHRLGSFIRGMH